MSRATNIAVDQRELTKKRPTFLASGSMVSCVADSRTDSCGRVAGASTVAVQLAVVTEPPWLTLTYREITHLSGTGVVTVYQLLKSELTQWEAPEKCAC